MDSNEIIKRRLRTAFLNNTIAEKIRSDFTITFSNVGCDSRTAQALVEKISEAIGKDCSLAETETTVKAIFEHTLVHGVPFHEALKAKLRGREALIVQQIIPYLQDLHGPVIDYGAGSGEVAQGVADALDITVHGYDVRSFVNPGVTVPMRIFNGSHVPVRDNFYEAGIMTNVAHHEANNELIIQELTRTVRKRLVVLETVPANETKEEWERTFANDVLWNRFFVYANIPVPGTYELPSGWEKRFAAHGWRCVRSEHLGYDQPTVRDLHHLLVFEK